MVALLFWVAFWRSGSEGFRPFLRKSTNFEAVLFLGAAMSITAFPMLARIIMSAA